MARLRPSVLRAATLPAAALLAAAPSAPAQDVEFTEPPGWQVRADPPRADGPGGVYFVEMPPGWHVTTGPGAILWDPSTAAAGPFRLDMEVFLFDPEGRRQGFGFFVGGRELDGPDPSYVFFLLREGGEFLVGRRRGPDTEVIRPWTAHRSVMSYADKPRDAATAKNVLVLDVREDEVRFSVNGREMVRLPRTALPPLDGTVGLRVEGGLNLHVSRLAVAARNP